MFSLEKATAESVLSRLYLHGDQYQQQKQEAFSEHTVVEFGVLAVSIHHADLRLIPLMSCAAYQCRTKSCGLQLYATASCVGTCNAIGAIAAARLLCVRFEQ